MRTCRDIAGDGGSDIAGQPAGRDSIQRHARERGRREVTGEVIDEARSRLGM